MDEVESVEEDLLFLTVTARESVESTGVSGGDDWVDTAAGIDVSGERERKPCVEAEVFVGMVTGVEEAIVDCDTAI